MRSTLSAFIRADLGQFVAARVITAVLPVSAGYMVVIRFNIDETGGYFVPKPAHRRRREEFKPRL